MNNFSLVPTAARLDFLPALLGTQFQIYTRYENAMFSLADEKLKDYKGGYWHFAKIEKTCGLDTLGFIYPDVKNEKVFLKGNYGTLEMGAVAAGACMTVMVLNRLCIYHFNQGDKALSEHLDNLAEALQNWVYGYEGDSIFSEGDRRAVWEFLD